MGNKICTNYNYLLQHFNQIHHEITEWIIRIVVHRANKQIKQSAPISCLLSCLRWLFVGAEEGRWVPAAWLAERTGHVTQSWCALPSPTHSPPLPSPPVRASITPLQPLMQPAAGRGNKPALVTAVTAGVILMVVWAIDCFSTRSGEHLQGGRSHLVPLLHCPPTTPSLFQDPLK